MTAPFKTGPRNLLAMSMQRLHLVGEVDTIAFILKQHWIHHKVANAIPAQELACIVGLTHSLILKRNIPYFIQGTYYNTTVVCVLCFELAGHFVVLSFNKLK